MEYLPPLIRWIYRKGFIACRAIDNAIFVAKKQAG